MNFSSVEPKEMLDNKISKKGALGGSKEHHALIADGEYVLIEIQSRHAKYDIGNITYLRGLRKDKFNW